MGFLSKIFDPDAGDARAQYQQIVKPADLQTSQYGSTITQGASNQGQARADQTALSRMLFDQARGAGPNLADAQLRTATDRANANAASAIGSIRGINPALAAKQIADNQAQQNQQMAGQSAQLRGQQQLAAQDQLGSLLAQQRQQDIGVFGTAGQLQNAQNQGQVANQLGAAQINAGLASGAASNNAGMVGGLLNAAGSAAAVVSDERAKTDVQRGPGEAVPGVPEASFRYKGEPEGVRHEGVIAQDLERVRPDLVGRTPGGMRTVPAQPPFFKFADGGQVPSGELHSYLDSLSAPPAPVGVAMAGGGMATDLGAGAADPWFSLPTSDAMPNPTPAAPAVTGEGVNGAPAAAPDAPSKTGKAVGAGLSSFGKSMQAGTGQAAFDRMMALRLPSPSIYAGAYAGGGQVPVLLSPQEHAIPPSVARSGDVESYVESEQGKIPGRAQVSGDSPKNDTVKATLPVGAVVVPRSITQGPNAAERSAAFVSSVLKRNGGERKMSGGGLAAPAPAPAAALPDYSEGGVVEAAAAATPPAPSSTARGRGRDETRRRIKKASAPAARSAED